MKHRSILILGAAFLFSFGAPAFGNSDAVTGSDFKTVSFQNGLDRYAGAVETRLVMRGDNAAPETPVIWISVSRDSDTGALKNAAQALSRFDGIFGGGPGQIPPGSPIVSATLRLHTGPSRDAGSGSRLVLHRMLLPWERDARWDSSAWGRDGVQPDGAEAVADIETAGTLNNNNTSYDLDVTESLRAWSAGAPNLGWLLQHQILGDLNLPPAKSTNALAILSSLATGSAARHRPALTVTYDANPANRAPSAAQLDAAREAGSGTARLSLRADDPDGGPLTVTFLARRQPVAERDFQIILLPDTQYYARKRKGGTPEMFHAQTHWIVRHAQTDNIACVLHLGDITDRGDVQEYEWENASKAMYRLENPKTTGRQPDGIPYCLAVGNHDQRKAGNGAWGGPAILFNKYFGAGHFKDKSYYGGHCGDDNNNYYMTFEAGAEKFIVVSLEYKAASTRPEVLKWAGSLLEQHATRRAIVITHGTLRPGVQSEFCPDGAAAYKALRHYKNLMLIIGGHITGEGRRTDTYNGATVHSILMDFQGDALGGDGHLGVLTLSPRTNKIHAGIYSPVTQKWRTYNDADYALDYDFGTKTEPFARVSSTETAPGATANCRLENMDGSAAYEWIAEISDRGKTTRTSVQSIPPVR